MIAKNRASGYRGLRNFAEAACSTEKVWRGVHSSEPWPIPVSRQDGRVVTLTDCMTGR